jgi:hypothetical protein
MQFSVKTFYLLVIPLLFLFLKTETVTAGNIQGKYLSQEAVDTSINRAFYILTEASEVAGVGFKQKEALESSKRIAKSLRERAKGDPNERYILWKINELEAQIYLEEKDLLLNKMQQGVFSINMLITRYNGEVGKNRPDFATLRKIHVQMSDLDRQKGNELSDSYNKRYKAISREVLFSIEKAVIAGDVKKAVEELGYCLRNKNYLAISDSKYAQIENRVENLIRAYDEKPKIESELDSAAMYLSRNKIGKAQTLISSSRYRFKEIESFLPQRESSILNSRTEKAQHQLVRKEDSLVNVNISILRQNGIPAANDYLQKVLKTAGIDRTKSAYVDSVILMISTPDKQEYVTYDKVEPDDDTDTQKPSVLEEMRLAAQKKAQKRIDSLRIEEEKRLFVFQKERARKDSLMMIEYEKKAKIAQQNKERASSIAQTLYALMDQNNMDQSSRLFTKEQQFLKTYLVPDAFMILEITIQHLTEDVAVTTQQQIAYLKPVVSDSPAKKVTGADSLAQHYRQRAEEEIIKLYSLLEKNDIEKAYKRFQTIKEPLQKYCDKDVFDHLETTIIQTYNYYR